MDTIKKETADEIIKHYFDQGLIGGDIENLVREIYSYEEGQ